MKKTTDNISENSIWNTKTPTPASDILPVSILEAGHFYANIDYYVSRKFHNSFLLLYTVSGKGLVSYEGKEYIISEKQAMVIDCRRPHEYRACESEWDFLWLHFNGRFAEDMVSFLYPDELSVIRVHNQAAFSFSFNKIIDKLDLFDANHCFSLSCELQNMILSLATDRSASESGQISRMDRATGLAIEYMEEHISEEIAISTLSKSFNVSEYHFIRNFKKATGVSPYNYLIGIRITKAKRLLVESDYSIEEISGLCGFNDTANFISKFKRLTGETPLKYRKAFS